MVWIETKERLINCDGCTREASCARIHGIGIELDLCQRCQEELTNELREHERENNSPARRTILVRDVAPDSRDRR